MSGISVLSGSNLPRVHSTCRRFFKTVRSQLLVGKEKCICVCTHFPSRFSRTPVQRTFSQPKGRPSHSPKSSKLQKNQATVPDWEKFTFKFFTSKCVATNLGSSQNVSATFWNAAKPSMRDESGLMISRFESCAVML